MKYEAANEFLKNRLTLPTALHNRGISDALPPAVRAHCFFSARVAEARVLEKLRAISDAYSRGDLGLSEARDQLQRWLDSEGVGDRAAAAITNISSTMRLNLILRQNAAMAAAVGRYQVSRDPDIEERWPCWRYITGPNPRPEHAALNGKVLRKSDPFWKTHYPPWDFNCNCDVEDSDEEPQKAPPHDDRAPASGFQFDPAEPFREFDMSSIEDERLRKRVVEKMRKTFGKIDKPGKKEEALEPTAATFFKAGEPAGKPVSEAFVLKSKNEEISQAVKEAMAAVDSVHGDGVLAPDTPIFGKQLPIGLQGETVWKPGGQYYINLSTRGEHKTLTALHEIGHFLDWSGLSMNPSKGQTATFAHPLLEEWRETVKKTRAYREIEKRIAELGKKKDGESKSELKHYRYLFKSEELFARGYAQYIANKCSNPKIKAELEKELGSVYCKAYHTQWEQDDFAELSKAYDNLFKAKGWIK